MGLRRGLFLIMALATCWHAHAGTPKTQLRNVKAAHHSSHSVPTAFKAKSFKDALAHEHYKMHSQAPTPQTSAPTPNPRKAKFAALISKVRPMSLYHNSL